MCPLTLPEILHPEFAIAQDKRGRGPLRSQSIEPRDRRRQEGLEKAAVELENAPRIV